MFNGAEIPLMGHLITNEGLKTSPAKIDAVAKMTKPTDVKSIQRFIGFVTYLSLFLPDLSNHLEPLRQQEYNYLYFKLTTHGKFAIAMKQLADKAKHTMFSTKKKVDFHSLNPKLAIKIFESIISPILLYIIQKYGVHSLKAILINGINPKQKKFIPDSASYT
ncbi:Hypothetical predicted protein [Paramuricea clavata]|uniref:Uncharacterized protein n=1 Tax=Paramuricea clavata TaxID=317549 RepID=A0A6S7FGX4_PARCT|nr:Hypothetical predicted protein [Paramuricea clavata]